MCSFVAPYVRCNNYPRCTETKELPNYIDRCLESLQAAGDVCKAPKLEWKDKFADEDWLCPTCKYPIEEEEQVQEQKA